MIVVMGDRRLTLVWVVLLASVAAFSAASSPQLAPCWAAFVAFHQLTLDGATSWVAHWLALHAGVALMAPAPPPWPSYPV